MSLRGTVSAAGIDRRKVVDVPNERIASPAAEKGTIVAGLSPVNGVTIQSAHHNMSNKGKIQIKDKPGLKPHRLTHQSQTVPSVVPPKTGSGPSLERSSGPPHVTSSLSSHLDVSMFMRFMPLASATSIGAIEPRRREGTNEDTSEMRAVDAYASGLVLRT